MSKAEELALQADLLTDRRLESDAYEWSVDADVQLRWDAAELRRLSAVEAELAECKAAYESQFKELHALKREVAGLEKDAGRYRWLRSVPNGFKAQRIVNDTPTGMDAAIDAAILDQP